MIVVKIRKNKTKHKTKHKNNTNHYLSLLSRLPKTLINPSFLRIYFSFYCTVYKASRSCWKEKTETAWDKQQLPGEAEFKGIISVNKCSSVLAWTQSWSKWSTEREFAPPLFFSFWKICFWMFTCCLLNYFPTSHQVILTFIMIWSRPLLCY